MQPAPAATALPVLHRDALLAVIDKPAGLMVHASAMARGERDFALDRLQLQFGQPVFAAHRLDRATSGCLLVAFDRDTAAALGRQFMARTVRKDYLAVCRGWPAAAGVIDHPLDGGPGKPLKKPALTHYRRLATGELPLPSGKLQAPATQASDSPASDSPASDADVSDAAQPMFAPMFASSRYALLECTPHTGRYRQIRRHLKHLSHHLIGDSSHGDGRHNRAFRMLGVQRMLLHAWRLQFDHPASGAPLAVSAPLDDSWQRVLRQFGWCLPDVA